MTVHVTEVLHNNADAPANTAPGVQVEDLDEPRLLPVNSSD